jgi:DNA-binding IclR family transcriptional regulator
MYRMDEMDLWTQRRHELARETESGRLARRLRAARSKRVAWFRGAHTGQASAAPVPLRAESGGRA